MNKKYVYKILIFIVAFFSIGMCVNAEEKEITDNNLKKELDNKISILNDYGVYYGLNKSEIYSKNIKVDDLDELDIVRAIANISELENDENAANEFDKTIEFGQGSYAYSITEINNIYQKLIGKEISKNNEKNEKNGILITYDWDKKLVYYTSGGGGTCGEISITYNYKYTQDNNNAYVYVAVGTEKCPFEIYSDYEGKNLYKKINENEDFNITEQNYQSFESYKLTFSKKNTDYNFAKIEKLLNENDPIKKAEAPDETTEVKKEQQIKNPETGAFATFTIILVITGIILIKFNKQNNKIKKI